LPIVNEIARCSSKIARAGSHELPPFVVRANTVCERSANVCRSALRLTLSLGNVLRSHTAKTKFGSNGSAVIDSLSTNSEPEPLFSRWSVIGSLQAVPPFVDLLTRIALSAFVSLNDSAI